MKIALFLSLFVVSVVFGAVEVEEFGFNGRYKTGTWVPLWITIRSQDQLTPFIGELVVEVRSYASDTPIERYASALQFSPIEAPLKNFYVYCPKNATQLVVQLMPTTVPGNTALYVTQEIPLPTPLSRKDYLVLVLAPSGDKLKRFIDKKRLAASDGGRVHVENLPHSTALPRAWIGYSAVDILVIRETTLTERGISKAQQTALLDWVQRGGTLILSGGSDFNAVRSSFVEPFLPVELKSLKKTRALPVALHKKLGFQSLDINDTMFEHIQFSPKVGCEPLIGTEEQIYVAKRKFGDGQIICLAFDYNAPPFSEQQVGETFWHALLSIHGKSPRHLADQYALALQHEEKIHKKFLLTPVKTGTLQGPLVKLLFIFLPIYLLSFGGFVFYFGRSKQKVRAYWIGGCLLALLSVSTIAAVRNVFPNSLTADRLSILSVYPERQRAHLLSYVSLRSTARAETSIGYRKNSFIRRQEVEDSGVEPNQKIGTLVQDSHVQLRDLLVDPWHPTTYVKEVFLDQLPRTLENAWRVTGKEMTYLGNVALDTDWERELSTALPRVQMTRQIPSAKELSGTREWLAQILRSEQVLRHLAMETDPKLPSYLIGWTSQGFTDMVVDGNVNTNDETLVIFRPGTGP